MSGYALYHSQAQGLYALVAAPALFLAYLALRGRRPPERGADPELRRFVWGYAWVFAALALADPLVTGPLVAAVGAGGTAAGLAFVLIGDFRVYLLVLRVGRAGGSPRAALGWAIALTPAVAVAAYALHAGLGHARGAALPDQALWLLHELLFAAVMGVTALRWVPSRRASTAQGRAYARELCAYVAGYYALWAASDVLILAGSDTGWWLRVVPNQLYYGLWLPFAWWRFAVPRAYASTSASTQASR